VKWPTDKEARDEVRAAIRSCRPAFERAYTREPPTPGDVAVLALLDLLSEEEEPIVPRQLRWHTPPWDNRGPRAARDGATATGRLSAAAAKQPA
jgi:hypothetical protein